MSSALKEVPLKRTTPAIRQRRKLHFDPEPDNDTLALASHKTRWKMLKYTDPLLGTTTMETHIALSAPSHVALWRCSFAHLRTCFHPHFNIWSRVGNTSQWIGRELEEVWMLSKCPSPYAAMMIALLMAAEPWDSHPVHKFLWEYSVFCFCRSS